MHGGDLATVAQNEMGIVSAQMCCSTLQTTTNNSAKIINHLRGPVSCLETRAPNGLHDRDGQNRQLLTTLSTKRCTNKIR